MVNCLVADANQKWYTGPTLQKPISYAAMVKHPDGGIVLIGGQSGNVLLNTIYYLQNAYSEWKETTQKLLTFRRFHTALLVPRSMSTCQEGIF